MKEQKSVSKEQAQNDGAMNIEETFAQLDELIDKLESPEITLEQSFQAYARGMELLKACNDKIDKVEKQVLVLTEDGGFDELGERES